MGEKKRVLTLDPYEYGVIFHSLKDKRNRMIKENEPTDAVDDVLIKVIDQMEKPERAKRGRRFHEDR